LEQQTVGAGQGLAEAATSLLGLLLFLVFSIDSSSAFAATAIFDPLNGNLIGASNVLVGSIPYDVQFLDGTCIDLYDGCQPTPYFHDQFPDSIPNAPSSPIGGVA
jgi:hypothetical protein